jgi:CDP-diglyceride synthetase
VSSESRLMAGILLILLPTVVFGGTSILSMLIGDPEYAQNQLRQDLWRAGYAHVGVLLVLSLVTLRYVDEAALSGRMKRLVRHSIPAAAILLPVAFFLSVLSPAATDPNAMIYLAYVGAISLTLGLLVLGIGLIRERSGAAEYGAIDVVERNQSQ